MSSLSSSSSCSLSRGLPRPAASLEDVTVARVTASCTTESLTGLAYGVGVVSSRVTLTRFSIESVDVCGAFL